MSTESSTSRRQFLQKLTAAVGGTATLAVVSKVAHAAPAVQQESAVTPVESKGYQHTAHVDTYYQLADF